MFDLNNLLPSFHTVVEKTTLNKDEIQHDVLYKHGDYVLLLNEKTLAVGLDKSFLTNVVVEWGMAAKAARQVLDQHFPHLLGELWWKPMYLEQVKPFKFEDIPPTPIGTLGEGYPIQYIGLAQLEDQHWDEIIAWFNQKPPLTEILELISRNDWELICTMLEEISEYQRIIFKLQNSSDENALAVLMDCIESSKGLERLITDVNFSSTHDELIEIIRSDIYNWDQFISKTIGTENWYTVKRLIVRLQNEQRKLLNL